MSLKANLKLSEKGMRIVNGPIIMTREERMKIVHEIKERILDKYGDDVKAIGVYGSLGRQTDGPCFLQHELCKREPDEAGPARN